MNWKDEILKRFEGKGGGECLYLPDLTLWYEWHRSQGSLPSRWQGATLPQIAREMGVPLWLTVEPWWAETEGVEIETREQEGERRVHVETAAGPLDAVWTMGPDGDWWQTEYPVKGADDLAAALALAQARAYVLDELALERVGEMVGEGGVVVLQLPKRPFSELLHDFLGWGEGLVYLGEAEVQRILIALEGRLQNLVQEISQLPGEIVLSPDNLDGQYIPPKYYDKYLRDSYRLTMRILHRHEKRLVVHVGGPMRHLLAPLAEAEVDGIEGVAGPPQSNASLAEARALAGPEITLWGGIPQDFLMEARTWGEFEEAVGGAVKEARGDGRAIVGVADRVPAMAELERLEALPEMIKEMG